MHQYSQLLVILGVAGLMVPLLHRFRISPVIGFLLCGIIVSPLGLPSLLGGAPFTLDQEAVTHFADLGVLFLMFMIGLKLSLQGLWKMRRHVLGLGTCQLVLTGIVIFAVAKYFRNSDEVALLMAACFALSSTAVVMQLLEEKHKTSNEVGKLCFSILLMQDLAVVPILAMLAAFSGKAEGGVLYLSLRALGIGALAITAIYHIGTRVLKPLIGYINPHHRREWLVSFVLFIVIGLATLTEMAGLSAALGAFLAGLLFAETEQSRDINDVIAPVKGLLMGVFFLSVGLMIDLQTVAANAVWLFSSVIGIGMLKAATLYAVARCFRIKPAPAAETAMMLGQSGEFVFVILTLALSAKIIPANHAQFFMLVTALSMLMTPFVARLAPAVSKLAARDARKRR